MKPLMEFHMELHKDFDIELQMELHTELRMELQMKLHMELRMDLHMALHMGSMSNTVWVGRWRPTVHICLHQNKIETTSNGRFAVDREFEYIELVS